MRGGNVVTAREIWRFFRDFQLPSLRETRQLADRAADRAI